MRSGTVERQRTVHPAFCDLGPAGMFGGPCLFDMEYPTITAEDLWDLIVLAVLIAERGSLVVLAEASRSRLHNCT
jgi:hypothetical protein